MTSTQNDTPKKWYKKWWGISLLAFGGLMVIGSLMPKDETTDYLDNTPSDTSYDWGDTPTTTTWTAPPTTTNPPTTTQAMSDQHLAYLTIMATIPAFEDAGATESQVWELLGTVCNGFDGGLDYLDIGTMVVNAADSAGISPFGYEEAGALVGTATTVRCPEYDGWQN